MEEKASFLRTIRRCILTDDRQLGLFMTGEP
jgi:hypothetical protein